MSVVGLSLTYTIVLASGETVVAVPGEVHETEYQESMEVQDTPV